MQKIKRIEIAALALILCLMTGCASRQATVTEETNESTALNVYATFYPLYAIADMILQDTDVQLNCLVQPQDGCFRSYSLSDWDLALLTGAADVVIAGGSGLESFESLLYALGDDGPVVVSVLYDMDLKEQKAVNSSEDTDSHWLDENPHIYMSIDGAMEIAERIAESFSLLMPENAELYSANLDSAKNSLSTLQNTLLEEIKGVKKKRVIVMNEALVYAAEEYGLKVELYYERESGEAIEGYDWQSCLDILENSDSRIVLLEKQAPDSLVSSLRNSGFVVVLMDTMSTKRAEVGAEGYFAAHQENVQALIAAFTEASASLE